jgi:hypothetical protein
MNSIFVKQVGIFFLIICILGVSSFVSCVPEKKIVDNDVVFDTIQVNKIHFYKDDTTKLSCNLHLSYTYPKEMKDAGKLKKLQAFFNEKFFVDTIAVSPPEAVSIFEKQYIRSFDAEDFYGQDYDIDTKDFSYYQIIKNQIIYNKNDLISFTVENECFEGGAHGAKSIYGAVVNLNTGELLTETDFAGDNFDKNISSIIIRKIMETNDLNDIEQLENMGYYGSEILPNGNFTLDDKGITYYFNEYEIAAYFVGITKVFIPYEELRIYISDDNPISTLAGL